MLLLCCDLQLDVAQLLALKPIVIIDDKDNITAMLSVLRRFAVFIRLQFACSNKLIMSM